MQKKDLGLGVKLGLVLFGLLLGLGGAEIALRMLRSHPAGSEFESLEDLRRAMLRPGEESVDSSGSVPLQAIVTPHPNNKIIYDLRPNLDVRFQRVPVQTNRCGMRDREHEILKPPDTYRIALLGDSFAFGWGVEQDKIFAQVLEDNLNRIGAGRTQAEVLNFGVPGYSTFQEVEALAETGFDFEPDAILVFFIQNDFGLPFFVRNIENPSGGFLTSTKLVELVNQGVSPALREQRNELVEYNANRALLKLSDMTREKGIPLLLAINPKKGWEKYRDMLWALKQRPDIQLIELRTSFMETYKRHGYAEKELTLSFDPHPSALRHKILGDILTPYFMEAFG